MNTPTVQDVRSFILRRISSALLEKGIKPENVSDDFDLLSAGVVDSLGVIELITAVEQQFQITVDFERIDPVELTVIGPFSRFVAQNAAGKAPLRD